MSVGGLKTGFDLFDVMPMLNMHTFSVFRGVFCDVLPFSANLGLEKEKKSYSLLLVAMY